ncbi:GNAT family N-acetyltransferase [Actinoplanes sp. NPDC049596]|uniref:GNAT family N-acetyltransferase n=1 Tax=unclassified Actinoplanes TaxID=2626549 RepID=UPI003423930E
MARFLVSFMGSRLGRLERDADLSVRPTGIGGHRSIDCSKSQSWPTSLSVRGPDRAIPERMTILDAGPLDNPVWGALSGPQTGFAEVHGRAARFAPGISPFHALADAADPAAWADLAALTGGHDPVFLPFGPDENPPGWEIGSRNQGVQLVGSAVRAEADPEAVTLTRVDVPEMLDLVARTRPGPFENRTVELGAYLGIRRDGRLIAMAGERLRLSGHTEISAVCTDPAFRGHGLARRLVSAVAAGIVARGETPFLHAAIGNTNAIRLYEKMGFSVRRPVNFHQYRRLE